MNNFLKYLLLLTCLGAGTASGQEQLPVAYLAGHHTLHFLSPEPIQYADISSKALDGDLPLKNLLRIKLKDSVRSFSGAVVTITGEKFIAQYRIMPSDSIVCSRVNILPPDMQALDISGIGLSQLQLRKICLDLFTRNPGKKATSGSAYGITGQVSGIYGLDDYLFLDLSFFNRTNLKYTIEDLRFAIVDKKVTKATNIQSVPVEPVFTLLQAPVFDKHYRNIIVLRKMSFPDSKILEIVLREQQLSGRVIELKLPYRALLHADTPPSP